MLAADYRHNGYVIVPVFSQRLVNYHNNIVHYVVEQKNAVGTGPEAGKPQGLVADCADHACTIHPLVSNTLRTSSALDLVVDSHRVHDSS